MAERLGLAVIPPAGARMRSRRSPPKRRMHVYIGYPPALEAVTLIGPSGLVFGTDISLPVLEGAKRNADGLPLKFVAMDGQALACADTRFDAVTGLVGLMFF